MRGNGCIRAFLGGVALAGLALSNLHPYPMRNTPHPIASPVNDRPDIYIETYVTGYNTVRSQTDDTPCIAASGANICGRRDTIACPPFLPLGAIVKVRGVRYVCEDRMAHKYRMRFDINCDKDKNCPRRVTGWTSVKVERAPDPLR